MRTEAPLCTRRPHTGLRLSRTKNVRVSEGDRRRNQPHPYEDDKPPGRWFLRSSSHLAILPPNTLRHYGRYIRSSSPGPLSSALIHRSAWKGCSPKFKFVSNGVLRSSPGLRGHALRCGSWHHTYRWERFDPL